MILHTGLRTDIPAFYPESPLLLGEVPEGVKIHEAKQESWRDGQLMLW